MFLNKNLTHYIGNNAELKNSLENERFNNLEEISIISTFLNGAEDFVLVGDDLEFGVCIERTEYHYEFSM